MTRASLHYCAPALAIALAGSAAIAAQQRDSRVIADVAGRPILAADVQARVAADRKKAAAENRMEAFGTKAVDAALEQLVDVKLFAAAARDEGLPNRPEVRHAIEQAIDELLAQTLVAGRAERLTLDEAALRRYYDANPREFETPGRVRARHIVVKTEAEATALLGKARRGADFAQLASANNIDSTRNKGGDLGLVARGAMVDIFDAALFSLKVGDIGPVIQTPYGFHIIKVESIEPPSRTPFGPGLAGDIRQRILRAEVLAWKAEIRKKHAVSVNEQVLKSLR
jgi:peptidyl-prolyl cis-trans isomerase C